MFLKHVIIAKDLGKDQFYFKKKISNWIEAKSEEEFLFEFENFKKESIDSQNLNIENSKALNEYLNYYYKNKEKIVKCYTSQDFSAGASSTQRSESLNAVIKKHILIVRRVSFTKLIDCLQELSDNENYYNLKIQRITSMRHIIPQNSLHNSLLLECLSPFLTSKNLKQYKE